jgi:hypothetical protein
VRWPPKDGQPALISAERADLETPAAVGISRASACGATNSGCALMKKIEARPNV